MHIAGPVQPLLTNKLIQRKCKFQLLNGCLHIAYIYWKFHYGKKVAWLWKLFKNFPITHVDVTRI